MPIGGDQERMSKALASFVSDLDASDVPPEAFDVAERSYVDTVGVVLAGRGEREAAIGHSLVDGESVNLFGTSEDELAVAFVNAMVGHCLDFDDCYRGSAIHPSVTVVPALFALSDEETSGQELLTAYVAGIEAQGYLSDVLMPSHYEAGWHATGTIGTLGVAAAVARLLGLDESAVEHALNVAASLPAGLKRNFGTTTKSIHAGQAARSGITAAMVAEAGATADANAIDGIRGFVDLYDGQASAPDAPRRSLGSEWAILDPGIQLKKFPCCNFTHASIEAALQLRQEVEWVPDGVDQVTVSVSEGAVETVTHEDPSTPLEAKFSFPYTVAAALATGEITLSTFDRDALEAPETQRLREQVSVGVDPDLPYGSLAGEVTVASDTGEEATNSLDHPPGAGPNPLAEEALREKFRQCAAGELESTRVDDVFDELRSLRDHDSLRNLAGL